MTILISVSSSPSSVPDFTSISNLPSILDSILAFSAAHAPLLWSTGFYSTGTGVTGLIDLALLSYLVLLAITRLT